MMWSLTVEQCAVITAINGGEGPIQVKYMSVLSSLEQ